MDLKELNSGIDPYTHWYYQTKKIPLFKYFEKISRKINKKVTIIDFGAGIGFFGEELLNAYPDKIEKVYLVDIGYTEEEIAHAKGKQVEKRHTVPQNLSHSLVIMMDVLEHIKDDVGVLRDIRQKISSDTYFFITVPAFQALWSSHDVYLEHYRRYTLSILKKALQEADFSIHNRYYIYGKIFPLVWLVRKIKGKQHSPEQSDMKPAHPVINKLLKAVISFEMRFRKMNKIAGVTCVAEGKIN